MSIFGREKSRGFTLVELLVSLSIVAVILSIVLSNQSRYTETASLISTADQMSITISQAQSYGIAVKESGVGSSNFSASYGVTVNLLSDGSDAAHIFFADKNANGIYDGDWSCDTSGNSECIEKTVFTNGVTVDSICTINSVGNENCSIKRSDIVFVRPSASASIEIFNSGGVTMSDPNMVGVKFVLVGRNGEDQYVTVYKTGQVSSSAEYSYREPSLEPPAAVIPTYATGGTVTQVGGYRVHTFTTSGTLNVSYSGDMEYLVVGGGGAGGPGDNGNSGGGGGGAGGFLTGSATISAASHSITIGAGGTGAVGGGNGPNGQSSSFASYATASGGGGGAYATGGSNNAGSSGASGGGGGRGGNGGNGTNGQGNRGGSANSPSSSDRAGGGGGGAGASGSDSPSEYVAGAGGAGSSSSISGSTVTYAGGGGGGGGSAGSQGSGGAGGGGAGGSYNGVSGTANTGGGGGGGTGGGGGSGSAGGSGGSGIVIIRYPYTP